MSATKIPQFDLARAVARIRPELEGRWAEVLDTTAFVGGGQVAEFERSFASYLGVGGCVGVANGTDALELALRVLDLRPGDEVIVPAYTFIATAGAVGLLGGHTVFVDVEPQTLNLDPARVEAAISERTVGVIGVHLYGRPCDIEALTSICERHGLWFLEDAAQAHGARYEGRRVGGFGNLSTWSFYPSKNLGAFGDGGAVTSNDTAALERLRSIANHGRQDHFTHGEIGRNSRLDGLQAAVLNSRLALLDEDNERRREIAERYRVGLANCAQLEFLEDHPACESVYHQMTALHPRRDALREYLADAGIGTATHYPRALHQQAAFEYPTADVDAPVAERAAAEVLCLPMFAELTDDEIDAVCSRMLSFPD
jgi:dTDP-4-amino-4,6-dideoxygalactose transaminase